MDEPGLGVAGIFAAFSSATQSGQVLTDPFNESVVYYEMKSSFRPVTATAVHKKKLGKFRSIWCTLILLKVPK